MIEFKNAHFKEYRNQKGVFQVLRILIRPIGVKPQSDPLALYLRHLESRFVLQPRTHLL